MSDTIINVWNSIYSETAGYTEKPDETIIRLIKENKITTCLDAGAGNGRHSIFLASNGVKTKAVDICILLYSQFTIIHLPANLRMQI